MLSVSVWPPDLVSLLVLLAHDLEPIAADREGLVAQVQVYLVLIDRAREHLGMVEDHGRLADVALRGGRRILIVVALVVGVVAVAGGGDWGGGRRCRRPAVMVMVARRRPRAARSRAVHVRRGQWRLADAGLRPGDRPRLWYQGKRGRERRRPRARRRVMRRVHRHAVRRVRVLLAVRRKHWRQIWEYTFCGIGFQENCDRNNLVRA